MRARNKRIFIVDRPKPKNHCGMCDAIAMGILFSFFLLLSQEADACSCAGIGFEYMDDFFRESAAVFEGRVESMEVIARRRADRGSEPNALFNFGLYKFRIHRSYKGQETGEIRIASGLGGGDCSVHFEVGSEYIVFAHPRDSWFKSYLATDICNGTWISYQAKAQIGFLRGEISSAKDFAELQRQMYSPSGTNATIAGRISGLDKVPWNGEVQAWRVVKELNTPYGFSRVSPDGSYQIPVHAGAYLVRAVTRSNAPFFVGYFKSADQMQKATPVEVLPGQHLKDINFSAREPVTYTVTGKIKHPLWPIRPVEQIKVILEDRDPMTNCPTRYAECRSDGSFQIENIYPSRYHVVVKFGFEEPDQSREWKAEIPVIRVPEQTTEIVINVRSNGSWIPLVIRKSVRVFRSWNRHFGWIIVVLILGAIGCLLRKRLKL
jgi:hypothetical protein